MERLDTTEQGETIVKHSFLAKEEFFFKFIKLSEVPDSKVLYQMCHVIYFYLGLFNEQITAEIAQKFILA